MNVKLWELQVESIVLNVALWIYRQECSDFIFLLLNRYGFDSKPSQDIRVFVCEYFKDGKEIRKV